MANHASFWEQKEKRIIELDRYTSLVETSKRVVASLPDSLGDFHPVVRVDVDISAPDEIDIKFPMDLTTKAKVIEIVEGVGWAKYWEQKYHNVDEFLQFRHPDFPGITLELMFTVDSEFATCRRVQVGEEIVVKPIYRLEGCE